MQYLFQLLLQYKWSVGLGLFMFIFCLLILSFGIWITLLVVLLTILAATLGFMKDNEITFSDLIKNFK